MEPEDLGAGLGELTLGWVCDLVEGVLRTEGLEGLEVMDRAGVLYDLRELDGRLLGDDILADG